MRKSVLIVALSVIVAVLLYGRFIEPRRLQINHLKVTNPSLNELLAGRTAVHITDLHISGDSPQTQRVLDIIAEIQPDFIFLIGDYVPWDGDYEPALDFLSKLQAGVGVWAVMGDYDYSNDRKSCLFCHEPGTGLPTRRHRVKFLRDSIEKVEIDGNLLQIVGLEWGGSRERGFAGNGKWLEPESSTGGVIALVHNPLSFDAVPDDLNALVLSGDTHGGQLYLPGWFWSLIGYDKNQKYNQGLFSKGGSQMYVGRGAGTSHVEFRLGCRPEITILHF